MVDTIYRDYKAKQALTPQAPQSPQQSQSAISKKIEKPVSLVKRFLISLSNTNETNNSELKVYFSEPVIGFELSVLDYWKENRERYPILHAIATEFLGMVPTKVASERSVSLAGLTITDIRSSLNPNTANQTTCLSSWQKLLKNLK